MASLRSFVARLESGGELQRIDREVDWRYQIWDRTRAAQAVRGGGPALLFSNILGYPGRQLLTNGLGRFSRIALALDCAAGTSYRELVEVFGERASRPLQPRRGQARPSDEVVLRGREVDLELLPVPWLHRQDGGRYIGTWHINVTCDPDTRTSNVGVYRMQLLDKRQTTLSVSPRSHLRLNLEKAAERNAPLEMAVAIGVDETLVMAAAAAPPYGVDEFALAGGLRQKEIDLAPCVGVDLQAPADAEIVLEGRVDPSRRVVDGPFFDYAGVPNSNPKAFVFEVSVLRFRSPLLFRASAIGYPGAEDQLLSAVLAGCGLLDFHGSRLRQAVQNHLLRRRWYRAFQLSGRVSQRVRPPQGPSADASGRRG